MCLRFSQVTQVTDERAEADFVVSRIQQLQRSGMHRWRDMAVLYRTNAQSRLFEEQLVRKSQQLHACNRPVPEHADQLVCVVRSLCARNRPDQSTL